MLILKRAAKQKIVILVDGEEVGSMWIANPYSRENFTLHKLVFDVPDQGVVFVREEIYKEDPQKWILKSQQ